MKIEHKVIFINNEASDEEYILIQEKSNEYYNPWRLTLGKEEFEEMKKVINEYEDKK